MKFIKIPEEKLLKISKDDFQSLIGFLVSNLYPYADIFTKSGKERGIDIYVKINTPDFKCHPLLPIHKDTVIQVK